VLLRTFNSTQEAVTALQEDGASFLGGGTLVVRSLNRADPSIKMLVRILNSAGDKRPVEVSGGDVSISAAATMADVIAHSDLTWLAPAAYNVGTPAVRNMATVGGNLYAESPYGDFAVALLALDAVVLAVGTDGNKTLPLEEFFEKRESTYKDCIVTGVRFTTPSDTSAFRFRKMSRVKPSGISVISIAAVITQSAQAIITGARVAYGAMAPTPIRVRGVEAALIGKPRTSAGVADALARAQEGTSPADDAIASAWYRRAIAAVQLKRLLLEEEL
jgi:CO/xanthine dehydrogenase FAD-binding subunit